MRINDATDATFDELTSTGTVVVAFYHPNDLPNFHVIRKALNSAAWKHDRKLKVVFAHVEECRAACTRLRVWSGPNFWIIKDGVRIADRPGALEVLHRTFGKTYKLQRDDFISWLSKHLPGDGARKDG